MSNPRYLVTARKYRPQTFAELVSQDHVSGTLRNALLLDRLAHAYLFSGPRGVGKTTAARILAKAINCTTPLDDRDQAEPCRTCESCRSFEEGRSLNIIEIDAASNNKVEDVRDLQETVIIPPQGAKKKVYIIDEVHMMSNAAFNALLKTLEEPPPHVLFIFATTEPHKVLPTILSRCQRFDFRRIAVPEIVDRLRTISGEENITADDGSLMLVARKGDGALRDALSVFDQAVSLCGSTLTYDALAEALGVVSTDLFFDVTRLTRERDRAGLLRLVDTLVQRGYDFQEFLGGLTEHLRNLLVAHTMQGTDLIEADPRTRERYAEEADPYTEADLLRMLMVIDEAEEAVKNSTQPRLKLEMTLLKLSHLASAADLQALIQKIDTLKPSPEAVPQATFVEPELKPEPESQPEPEPMPEPMAEEPEPPATQESKPASEPEPPEEPEPQRPTLTALNLFGNPALERSTPPPRPAPSKATENAFFAGSGALSAVPATRLDPHFGLSLQSFVHVWPTFTVQVTRDRIHVGAMLQHAEPTAIDRGMLQVSVPDAFHKRLLSSQHDYLQQHLAEVMQIDEMPTLAFVVDDQLTDEETLETSTGLDPFELLKSMRQENPVVRAIFERFGGEPVW